MHDILALTNEAGERGARLIVLPEGTVPAYVLGTAPVDEAQLARAQTAFGEIARRFEATIVYGSAYVDRGRTYNAALTLGPDGRLLGVTEKHFLWHFDRRWFASGRAIEPVDTPVGRLGVLVCADGRIPTIARTLVERGAELLVMPTAWVTSGRSPSELENVQADLFINVRAHENGVPFVAANKAGVERGSVAYCGKSAIVGADGVTIERAAQDGDAVVFAEIASSAASDDRSREHLMASALYLQGRFDEASSVPRARARIAIATAHDPGGLARLAEVARLAEATHLIAPAMPSRVPAGLACLEAAESSGTIEAGGLRVEVISYRRLRDPAALVPARLAGIDLFVCAGFDDGDELGARYVRTRALELRAYVVAIDRRRGRTFACDPDGAVLCGTFGALEVAAFAYDRARSDATTVAPGTDVIDGLRAVEPHYRAALLERYPELASGT